MRKSVRGEGGGRPAERTAPPSRWGGRKRPPGARRDARSNGERAEYTLQYCKFSFLCRSGTAASLFVVAIILFALGGAIPQAVYEEWQRSLTQAAVYDPGELGAAPVVGREYGGEGSSEEDDGVEFQFHVPTVTNADKVLTYGARPIMTERGPFTVRVYRQRHNLTFPSPGVAQFAEREFSVVVEGSLNEPVVVPNLAYRALEQEMLRIPDVHATAFEDAGIPILFSIAMGELRSRGSPLLKTASFAALVEVAFGAVLQSRHGGNRTALLDEWRTRRAAPPYEGQNVTHAFVLPPPVVDDEGAPGTGGNDSTAVLPISDRVARLLWTWSDPYSFLNPTTWTRYTAPVTASAIDAFAINFRNVDPLYSNDVGAARRHYLQIAHWVNDLLRATEATSTPGAEDDRTSVARTDSRAPAFEQTVADVLYANGLVDAASWDHVLPAQLGSNAVMGFATVILLNRTSGTYRSAEDWAGTTLMNVCPQASSAASAGSSLVDYVPHRTSYSVSVSPEFSCIAWRFSDASFRPYYSKMSSTTMKSLMTALGSGTSVDTFGVPGSRATLLLFNGIANLQQDAALFKNILTAAEATGGLFQRVAEFESALRARQAAQPGSAAETQAINDMHAASSAYRTHIQSSTVAGNNALCNAAYVQRELRSLGMSCYQLLDLGIWINYVAKNYIWFPRFVWRNVDGSVDPSTLRSGPLIRTTVRELLFGIYDSFYRYSRGSLYPGVGPGMYPTYQDWLRSGAAVSATLLAMQTGAADIGKVGDISGYAQLDTMVVWSQASTIDGNLNLRQLAPTRNRFDALERRGPTGPLRRITIWHRETLRPAELRFTAITDGPNEILPVWRYVASHPVDFLPYYVSDTRNGAPACLRSIANRAFAPGAVVGVDLLVGAPYMLGCDYSTQTTSFMGMPSASNLTHNSHVDVEPVTGRVASFLLQHSLFLRWRASTWYPYLRPTIGLVATVAKRRTMSHAEESSIHTQLQDVDHRIRVAIPAGLHTLATILLVSSLIMAFFAIFPPPEPEGARRAMKRRVKLRHKREAERTAEAERKRREIRRARVDPRLQEKRQLEREGRGGKAFSAVAEKGGFDTAVERLARVERVLPAQTPNSQDPLISPGDVRGADSVRDMGSESREPSTREMNMSDRRLLRGHSDNSNYDAATSASSTSADGERLPRADSRRRTGNNGGATTPASRSPSRGFSSRRERRATKSVPRSAVAQRQGPVQSGSSPSRRSSPSASGGGGRPPSSGKK